MLNHGLFDNAPPPSVSKLQTYLKDHGIEIHPGVAITNTKDGWGLVATQPLDLGQTLCKIPKPSLLSVRTSSLDIEVDASSSGSILALSLCLLHEFRLGPDSPFEGYLQSLPRSVSIPPLWSIGNEDERAALRWLRGTEADRDMQRRERDGLGLASLRKYYKAHPLPPTAHSPTPSPFEAFAHAFSLVSTRAFIIDMYHLVALAPFADILNHSNLAHTSLASDDFVCHVCGQLAECEHDMPYPGKPPLRLEHVDPMARERLGLLKDTVDMYIEVAVAPGEEVMNSYGEGIGDARLLVEWGFVLGGDTEGEVCNFDVGPSELELTVKESEYTLLYNSERAGLNNLGQVSTRLFCDIYDGEAEDLEGDVEELEDAWLMVQSAEEPQLHPDLKPTAVRLCDLLHTRLEGMYSHEVRIGKIFDLKATLGDGEKCRAMAIAVAMYERVILCTALERWEPLLGGPVM